jgi:hypothetical protein
VLINATTSDNNVAVGNQALWKTTSGGGSNVAVGYAALGNNTTGGGNTAIGATALVNNTSGGSNTAVGDSALYYNTTGGVANTAVGYDALENNTSGQENSALGQYALQSNTTQNGSTAVGAYALQAATAASTMLPGLAKNVPGTTAHHNLQENKEQQQIATDVAQNKSEAETAKNKAEAAAKLAPPGKEEEWSVVPNIAGPNGEPVQQEKHSGQIRVAPGLPAGVKTTKEGKAITPEMLYMQAHPNATAEELQNFLGKPVSAKDAKALNDTWNPIAQKAGLPANQFREGMTTAEVSQLAAALNGAIGKQQGAQKIVIEQGNANQAAEKAGTKWMMWPETETGRTIAGPLSMAEAQNATDIAEVPAQEVRDIINARGAVRIMTKVGDPKNPETNGTLQLIDSLDKDKKLGLLASRWNSFMTSGVGASPDDDPRIITLMNKNMLGDTATMLAHFGASGGRSPQMLQHFMDLANAKKMDAVTLKAGIKAMADYMQDKGMMPSKQGGGKGGGANNPPTGSIKVTDPNGGTHYFKDQAAADNFKKLAGIK